MKGTKRRRKGILAARQKAILLNPGHQGITLPAIMCRPERCLAAHFPFLFYVYFLGCIFVPFLLCLLPWM